MFLKFKTLVLFFSLILSTIVILYYLPTIVASVWFIGLLIFYWYSDDEPFWLAFFLILNDGFMSFFGFYEATLSPFPGMPSMELGQFYVILTILKSRYKIASFPLFFKKWLYIMGIYLVILIVLSLAIGVKGDMNSYFRIVKQTLPFLLFFSIPRLFKNIDDFTRFFALIFPIGLLASVSQIWDIVNLQPISSYLGAKDFFEIDVMEGDAIRSFYNPGIILLTMFGSLFYSSYKESKFNHIYLNLLTINCFSISFIAANRGWILGFGLSLILYVIFVSKFRPSRLLTFFILCITLFIIAFSFPVINSQITNAYNRFSTVENLAEGDMTAGQTNDRITERGPRVMKKWNESPVFGFGFSDEFRIFSDSHTGNQTLLLQSGIIGFLLMMLFFLYFLFKLFFTSILTNEKYLKLFLVFFIGWFIIHSTSGIHFSYGLTLGNTMTQVLFFCFGAFCLAELEGHLITDK
jgi:hypothetical protein